MFETEPEIVAELLDHVKNRDLANLQELICDALDRFDGYYESQTFQTTDGELVFDLVYEHGGGEGQGDSVERVYKVTLAETELFTFRETGFYDSYNGTEWNNSYEFVFPVQKMITVYETQK